MSEQEEKTTQEMPKFVGDLEVPNEEAEQAKAGSLTLNYTKVEFKNVGMGSAND